MFHGSVPADAQRIMVESVKAWNATDIYVGCSGNLTVERALAPLGRFRLHSNDVSIYTYVLGDFFAGGKVDVSLKPEIAENFAWMLPHMADPAQRAATVILASKLVNVISADGSVKDNDYWRRMLRATRAQWPEMHEKTTAKYLQVPLSLASYGNEDVSTWVQSVPSSAGFISYPPFFALDYENQYKKLELIFDWPKPTYQPLDDKAKDAFFESMTGRDHWLFGSNRRLDEYAQWLRGMAKTTNRGVPIYIYASNGAVRVVTPRQETESVLVKRLSPGVEVGSEMTIAPLNYKQFQALRSQYMNIHIRPGIASLPVAVLVDGFLVGVYAFSTAPASHGPTDVRRIYMLSDFPVRPTDYKNLAKLVLFAALSKESQLLAERAANHRIREVLTTAFAEKPVSMKYRGLFELVSRKENKDAGKEGDPADARRFSQRYMLNYMAPIGRWTLNEGLQEWKKRHGKRN